MKYKQIRLCRSRICEVGNITWIVYIVGSTPSAYKCYEVYNPTGGMNRHCGRDSNSGDYWRCQQQ